MPLPDHISGQLLLRTFWLGVQHPHLSRQELRAMAAQQLAEEQAEQAKHQHHQRRPKHPRAADAAAPRAAPGALLSKIFGLIDRIEARRQRPPAATPAPPAALPAPTLGERISDKLHDLAEAVGITQPEPPPKQFSLFASSDGVVREIAPDESPQLTSAATRNYRRTTIESEASRDEKRGGTPRQSWLIG
jgi:hypothetical protein